MGTRFDPVKGTLYDPGQTKIGQIIVRAKEQLAGVLRSDVVYFIDNQIDMGSQSIEVPASGLTFEGHGYDISELYSTDAAAVLFTSPVGGSGNLTVNRNTLYVTGAGAQIFDLDNDNNFGALELNTVNLGTFAVTTTSLGEIANYRQVRTSNFAAIGYTTGLTLTGDFAGMAFNDSILLNTVLGSTFLIAGAGLAITDGLSSDMNALNLTGASEWCDFADSNFTSPALMTLLNFRTRADDAIPNMDALSATALWQGCTGVQNTFIGAAWVLTTEAATILTAANTPVKMAGTTTADLDAWFDTNSVSNRLRYLGSKTIKVDVLGYIQLESASTESFEILIRQRDDSAAAWIELRTAPVETALKILGDRRGGSGIVATAILDENDYIEVWVQNVSNALGPTGLEQSTITVSERQS